ncbi:MAG: D-alanine--D-alanine ligase [Gammaproteobacteria bacterium]|nr:D-alanine--D-alanine ligase [Gammaproteobacteria bacterium]
MMRDYGKVLVLMGGWSNEREISLISGKSVIDSLISSGINAHELILDKNNIASIKEISPDRVFIILHGKGGEDGEIQTYLDKLSIPYTGSSSRSSEICMNKRKTKQKLLENNLQTPKYKKIENSLDIKFIEENFSYPFVVKPSSEGSSIGVFVVDNKNEFYKAINENRKISKDFIVEQYIAGEEYTVGIINNLALPSIRLKPPGKFYDYDAKYNSSEMQYICPSGLDNEKEEEIKKISINCFNILECSGWGRVDIILDKEKNPWIIEINTVPGMTEHSLLPMGAKEFGINFDELVLKILDSSFK